MSGIPTKPQRPSRTLSKLIPNEPNRAQGVIAWSSFFLVLLQSVCTFFAALSGLRLLIGVGSLASIAAAGTVWDHFHTDLFRIPMMGLGLVGSLLNLAVLTHIRYLRRRPAAQWRQKPLTPRQRRMERVQYILSYATFALIAIEEVTHFQTFHKF